MQLAVNDASCYEGNFPSFREPSEIGCFSLDHNRTFHNNNHMIKYLSLPYPPTNLRLDLSEGYKTAIKKEFLAVERLDFLLKWILAHQDDVKNHFKDLRTSKTNIDFVCYRGLLTNICATIYENKEDWLICATKYNSIIYLCAFPTEQDILRRTNMSEREKLMSSWGYKFEQYLTCDKRGGQPDTSVPVNEKEEYCIALKGRLGNHTLLFSAEVDGEDPAYLQQRNVNPASTKRYIELKTSRIITNERQDWNFCRYKLLKWWLQSFLVGIPKVFCGFRDDRGFVRNVTPIHIKEMPKMAQGLWSPAACFNFCSAFLDFVKTCVVEDDPCVVYKFYWKPGSAITCEEGSSEYQILPDWYISNVDI